MMWFLSTLQVYNRHATKRENKQRSGWGLFCFISCVPPSFVSCLRFLFLPRVVLAREDQSG